MTSSFFPKTSPVPPKLDIRNNFHLSTNFLLFLSVFFGLFPLQEIRQSDIKNLFFTWKSWMVGHALFNIISGLLISLGSILGVIKDHDLQSISNFTYFFRGCLTGVLFFKLALVWPAFLEKIRSVELILSFYPRSKNIRKKLKLINTCVLLLALVEHSLVQFDILLTSISEENGDILLGFQRFFAFYSYGYMFEIVPYNILIGFWIQYTNLNLAFSWTFLDMFICSTSILIASKISQVSSKVKELITREVSSEDEWRSVRHDYNRIYEIFQEYNKIFNSFCVLSFIVNIFFLLVQLFGAMKTSFTLSKFLYYSISFGLLVIRLTSVCMGGAQIYEESRDLSNLLVTMPSFIFNEEVKRLIVQLQYSPTILSVDGYFQASKGTLLRIAGALIAYEVILIQFDKELLRS